jgi:hypothetical protein
LGIFSRFLDSIPQIIEAQTGRRIRPTELKELGLATADSVNAVVATLSSSTFFWFWNVLSDCRNLNRRDILAFPLNPERAASGLKQKLAGLGKRYLATLQRTSRTMLKSGLKIETFDYAGCKAILDEIDQVLALHFGVTEEGLDFIINYDIKYRVAADAEGEDE